MICGLCTQLSTRSRPTATVQRTWPSSSRSGPELRNQPGFRLVVARTAGRLVGFALGYLVDRASGWWAGIRPDPPSGDRADPVGSVGDSFGIAELGVHPAWRLRGLASRLHEALLAGRGEPRVLLWVRADASAARATYARWGYRLLGPVPDRSPYQLMCLDRDHSTQPADSGTGCTPPVRAVRDERDGDVADEHDAPAG